MIRKQKIINAELNYILGSMYHTDILMITDAGYPIPNDAWVVDLAITKNFPDLVTVLDIISQEFIAEKIIYAEFVPIHNPPLHKELKRIFNDCDHELISPEEMMTEMKNKAKAFVRTGGISPWGNIGLVSGADLSEWFADPQTSMPEDYQERFDRVKIANKKS